jgi:hypothetical protein
MRVCSLGRVRTQPEEDCVQAKETGPHQTPNLLAPWPWIFQPLELWGINICYLSHSVCSIFGRTAQTDKDTSSLSSSLKNFRLETQEEPTLQFKLRGQKTLLSHLSSQAEKVHLPQLLFYWGLRSIEQAPPIAGGTISCTQDTIPMSVSSKSPYRHTQGDIQRIVQQRMPGQVDTLKFTSSDSRVAWTQCPLIWFPERVVPPPPCPLLDQFLD